MKKSLQRAAVAATVAIAPLAVAPSVALAQQAPPIQPGASITMGGSYCTLNWIYDGADGNVYAGTAGHCVESVGQRVSLASGSLGEAVEEFGSVAYIDDNLDYAFIEVDDSDLAQVDPSLKGHPSIPTGVSTTETASQGDLMQFSGHGVGFILPPLQQERVGILHSNNGTQHYILGIVTPGDSGGPVANITDGNKAFGIVNTVGVGVNDSLPYAGEGGVSLEGLLADAAAGGFPVSVRTVS